MIRGCNFRRKLSTHEDSGGKYGLFLRTRTSWKLVFSHCTLPLFLFLSRGQIPIFQQLEQLSILKYFCVRCLSIMKLVKYAVDGEGPMFLKPLINENSVTVPTNQHRETHPRDTNNLGLVPETTAFYTS